VFVAVGAAAAAVHWAVLVGIVKTLNWDPLLANAPAWMVAFAVSFTGHWRWTFGARRTSIRRATPRFLLVSALGFGLNQGVFSLLLHIPGLHYTVALALTLLAVAGLTYLLSHWWAFRVPDRRR